MKNKMIISLMLSFLASVCLINTASALDYTIPTKGNNIVGDMQTMLSQPGDTLHALAQRYDLGYYEMLEANPTLKADNIPAGTLVIIPTQFVLPDAPHTGIVINLAELRLYYYPPKSNTVYTFPVGIGRQGWETPLGVTSIRTKRENPTWTVPASIRKWKEEQGGSLPAVVGPGPDNPLGDYAMNLAWTSGSYLVHGTNDPTGVGMRSSSGCIRLYPWNIESLFKMVKLGTQVRVIDEPFKVGYLNNNLYLESHLPLQEDGSRNSLGYMPLVNMINKATSKQNYQINWTVAEQASTLESGVPILIGQKTTV